jgi:tyrosine-protein phosphatase SIW14
MRRFLPLLLTLALIATVFVPIAFAVRQTREVRNFRVVREGILYRSGQFKISGLERMIFEYDIRTVVNLRGSTAGRPTADDRAEEEFCRKHNLRYVTIHPRHWEGPQGTETADIGVREFVDLMADPKNHPVLVHCFAGIHRSGAYCAVYRMEFEGWTNEQALAELKALGYAHLDEEGDILGYLSRYKPRLAHQSASSGERGVLAP